MAAAEVKEAVAARHAGGRRRRSAFWPIAVPLALVAALDRRGSCRLLAIVANGGYLILAGTIVWRFLTPAC